MRSSWSWCHKRGCFCLTRARAAGRGWGLAGCQQQCVSLPGRHRARSPARNTPHTHRRPRQTMCRCASRPRRRWASAASRRARRSWAVACIGTELGRGLAPGRRLAGTACEHTMLCVRWARKPHVPWRRTSWAPMRLYQTLARTALPGAPAPARPARSAPCGPLTLRTPGCAPAALLPASWRRTRAWSARWSGGQGGPAKAVPGHIDIVECDAQAGTLAGHVPWIDVTRPWLHSFPQVHRRPRGPGLHV